MKLRIRDNSIRLRLTRSEVAAVHAQQAIECKIDFGGTTLRYGLEPSSTVTSIQASYSSNLILIRIPSKLAHNWSGSDEISLKAVQESIVDKPLRILIEKDFFCLKPRQHEIEDESDMYPHPGAATGHC